MIRTIVSVIVKRYYVREYNVRNGMESSIFTHGLLFFVLRNKKSFIKQCIPIVKRAQLAAVSEKVTPTNKRTCYGYTYTVTEQISCWLSSHTFR